MRLVSRDTRDADLTALGLLDEPVRRRLYEWVVSRADPVGREEAAKAVGVTRALATFHLDRLTEAGLLESGYRRLTGRSGPGAGRPARVYWRARRNFAVSIPERRYERVAHLFALALERLGGGSPPPALREVASELGQELGRAGEKRGAATRRLMRSLEEAGYEPYPDGNGDIRLRNCPFDALAQRHRPLVCSANLALSEGLVAGVQATDYRPTLDPQPGLCCVAFTRDRAPSAEAGRAP